MFNFVSLLKYKRQLTGNKLCKPAQRTDVITKIVLTCYLAADDRFEWR